MNQNYGDDENPIILKSEFILSLVEQLVGTGKLNAKEKSLIDRCTANVYRSYIANGFEGTPPTLKDFRQELLRQDEPEAREVALAIELVHRRQSQHVSRSRPTSMWTASTLCMISRTWASNSGQSECWWCLTTFSTASRRTVKRDGIPLFTSTRSICCFRTSIHPTSCSSCGSACVNTAHVQRV